VSPANCGSVKLSIKPGNAFYLKNTQKGAIKSFLAHVWILGKTMPHLAGQGNQMWLSVSIYGKLFSFSMLARFFIAIPG
jgi:hypothetical protein